MPVSGRPTKFPLLKITHGSSGPVTNRFQNVWYTAGTASWAFAWTRLRFDRSAAIVTSAASNRSESAPAVIAQPRPERVPVPLCRPSSLRVGTVANPEDGSRIFKVRAYEPLG